MGKLSYKSIIGWAAPVACALLVAAAGIWATAPRVEAAGTYKTGTDVVSGYQQVYIFDGVTKTYITSGRQNSYDPDIANNNYIAYVSSNDLGSTLVKLYNISTSATLILASTGTNLNPQVDSGKVVWESWQSTKWQISFYNGSSVSTIGASTSSVRPDISGDLIAYATKNGSNQWEAHKYTISTTVDTLLNTGSSYAWPRLSGTNVVYGFLPGH